MMKGVDSHVIEIPPVNDWQRVATLMRWRVRMIRNSISTDAGFLSLSLGALIYVAIVVIVSVQAAAGGTVAREMPDVELRLYKGIAGMHFFVITCIQWATLRFFRVSLQGDFRTSRWRALPVDKRVLRRAYVLDSFLNPGTVAALVAGWILVAAYSRPSAVQDLVACLLTSPIYVCLSQVIFITASDFSARFRGAMSWAFLLIIAAGAALSSGYFVSMATGTLPAVLIGMIENPWSQIILQLPPWGVPVLVAEHIRGGHTAAVFGILACAAAGGVALLLAGNWIASITEPE
jgi:hypothetical protein